VEAQIQMASVDVAEKKYKDAEEIYHRLHAAGRGGIGVLKGLAQAYAAQRKFDRAAELLTAELKKSPKSSELMELLAENAVLSGKPAEAAVHYRAAVAQNAVSAHLRSRLANALYDSGDIEGSLTEMEKACERSPKNSAYLLALGSILEQNGQRREAVAKYRAAIAVDPNNGFAMNNLAYNLAETGGDLDEALQYAKQALERAPLHPSFSDTLAWIYVRKQMNDTAIQIFSNLIRRNPDDPGIRYHYAVALLQQGDRARARTELQAALSRKPAKGEEQNIRSMMKKLESGT
jgi:Flp pilus assembly protein TadD